MITDRYYYHRLSAEEKDIYVALYKGIINLDKEIHLNKIYPLEKIKKAFYAMSNDNPHLYYFNQTHMDIPVTPFGSVLLPQYFCTREQIDTYNKRIETCISDIILNLDLMNCSEFEKVKRLHDYFCKSIIYDHEALETSKVNRLVAAHSVIGVFAKKRAVCEGIAKAFKMLLNAVDIAAIVVDGRASLYKDVGHSWNIVKIDGEPYHIDVTWDIANTKYGHINYDYFNVSEIDISKDHFNYEGTPKCMTDNKSYFRINDVYFNSVVDIEKYLLEGVTKGKMDFYFKISDEGHKIEEIANYARQFVISEAGEKGILAKVNAYYNKDQRIVRVVLQRM